MFSLRRGSFGAVVAVLCCGTHTTTAGAVVVVAAVVVVVFVAGAGAVSARPFLTIESFLWGAGGFGGAVSRTMIVTGAALSGASAARCSFLCSFAFCWRRFSLRLRRFSILRSCRSLRFSALRSRSSLRLSALRSRRASAPCRAPASRSSASSATSGPAPVGRTASGASSVWKLRARASRNAANISSSSPNISRAAFSSSSCSCSVCCFPVVVVVVAVAAVPCWSGGTIIWNGAYSTTGATRSSAPGATAKSSAARACARRGASLACCSCTYARAVRPGGPRTPGRVLSPGTKYHALTGHAVPAVTRVSTAPNCTASTVSGSSRTTSFLFPSCFLFIPFVLKGKVVQSVTHKKNERTMMFEI